jgi:DNA-binding LacI/PurR family transcriptional regulator
MKAVTIMDIAHRLGISAQSVGYAFGNYTNSRTKLSPEMRQRILETGQAMGYVPHYAGRRLARSRSGNRVVSFDQVGLISIMPPTVSVDWVCQAMLGGAEHELSGDNACIFFVRISQEKDWEKVERMTRAGGVDGWLLYGPVNDPVVERLEAPPLNRIPFVVLGDHRCDHPIHSANVDNAAVGRLAVQHLASLGHRRIAFLADLQYLYEQQICDAFRAAIREFDLDEDQRLVLRTSTSSDPNGTAIMDFLTNMGPTTALFLPSCDLAILVCRILKEFRVEVPRQMSVLTCDPVSLVAKSQNFSRIELSVGEVGREGARLLHQIVFNPALAPREVKVAPTLVEGWSTGPLVIVENRCRTV